MKRFLWILLGAAVIVGAVGFLVLPRLRAARRARLEGAAIETGVVTSVRAVTTVEASGPIEPQQTASLPWKVGGTVDTVNVQVCEQVQAGDILATIDLASAPANVVQA